jgi:predicted Zn-dependent protease
MMRFADNDNMLAMVFAHELTHNAREHIEAKLINRFLGSMIAVIVESGTGVDFSDILEDVGLNAFSQGFENEADYVGLYMYARAGFPVEDGIDLHRRLAAIHPGAIHIDPESSHPSSAGRFIALRKAAAEIAAKRAANRPLLPEEKTGADILKDLDKID